MAKTFETHADLCSAIACAVSDALPKCNELEAGRSHSNQSVSAYLNVTFWNIDDDGDRFDSFGGFKLRVSDHADRYGSDMTIRIDGVVHDKSDELGYCGCFIYGVDFDDLVIRGVSAIMKAKAEAEAGK